MGDPGGQKESKSSRKKKKVAERVGEMGRKAVKVLTRERDAVRETRDTERRAPEGLLDLGGEGERRKGPPGKEGREGRWKTDWAGGRQDGPPAAHRPPPPHRTSEHP